MAKIQPVKTMKEFVKDWDKKLDHIIVSFGMGEQVEDIKQDIYEAMCIPDEVTGKTGLESYDPERGSFSTYVYAMIMVKVRNARAKRHRENSVVLLQNFHVADDDDESMSNWSRDRMEARGAQINGTRSEKERVEFRIQLRSVFEALRTYAPRSSFFKESGECIVRDLHTLLDLILEGKTREEIVTHFQYSTGSVGVMFDQLRNVPELLELWEMTHDPS